MRRVTFSRNYTLSLARTCQCYCKYCAFATHQAHVHDPNEVERLLDEALRRNAKELLVLTGERPEVNPEVARRLRRVGARGLHLLRRLGLPARPGAGPAAAHQRRRGLTREDLMQLREVTASQGLMLESINPRPGRPPGLADQAPGECGWRRSGSRGSCESRSRAGSWSASASRPRTGSHRWRPSPQLQAEYGHIQEVILQNFVPHPRYYGAGGRGDRGRRLQAEVDGRRRRSARTCPSQSGPRPSRSTT